MIIVCVSQSAALNENIYVWDAEKLIVVSNTQGSSASCLNEKLYLTSILFSSVQGLTHSVNIICNVFALTAMNPFLC